MQVCPQQMATLHTRQDGSRQILTSQNEREHGFVLIDIPITAWVKAFFNDTVQNIFRYNVGSRATEVAEETVDVWVYEWIELTPAITIGLLPFCFAIGQT